MLRLGAPSVAAGLDDWRLSLVYLFDVYMLGGAYLREVRRDGDMCTATAAAGTALVEGDRTVLHRGYYACLWLGSRRSINAHWAETWAGCSSSVEVRGWRAARRTDWTAAGRDGDRREGDDGWEADPFV